MSASQLLVYVLAALGLQAGVALVVALGRWRRAKSDSAFARGSESPTRGAWSGWREFRVARRQYEDPTQSVCSFHLEPVDGAPLPPFTPGQFLTLAVPISTERTLTRCYSLSDQPNPSTYRISVKRVLSPPGVCSGALHDRVQVGDRVKVKAPAGRFVVDPEPGVPVVLIAGGIGITPMLSMLRAGLAAEPSLSTHLYYGVRHGGEHGFRAELEALARLHPNFRLNVVYSQPGPNDVLGRDFRHAGRVDVDLLRRTLPAGRHRFFVCGPPSLMASLIPALCQWGVRAEDIHHEAFGPASVRTTQSSPRGELTASASSLEINFRRSGRTLAWDGQDANLLELAERHDLPVESGCRSGSCGTCEVELISGTVRYAEAPEHELSPGRCLLCVGVPECALELEA